MEPDWDRLLREIESEQRTAELEHTGSEHRLGSLPHGPQLEELARLLEQLPSEEREHLVRMFEALAEESREKEEERRRWREEHWGDLNP